MTQHSTLESTLTTPRRAPVQERSIKRVNLILDITADLISEVGVEGVKTTEIARRAEIKLASLYRYFPNKIAIIKNLARRHFGKLEPVMANFLEHFDLDTGLDSLIDAYAEFYRTEPGYVELWSGIQATPELNKLDLDDLARSTQAIVARCSSIYPHLSQEDLTAIATVVTRSIGAGLRLAMTSEPQAARVMIRELKFMARSYLKERLSA